MNDDDKAIATVEAREITAPDEGLSVEAVIARMDKIHDLMNRAMKDGQHYGVIPGTQKPTLLQPGAQMLVTMFQMAPRESVERIDLPRGHREYIVTTHVHAGNGNYLGFGVGSCSTMEGRYRWRYEDKVLGPVPGNYWNLRKTDAAKAQGLIGEGNFTKKIPPKTGSWFVVARGERVENPDIADLYNTVLKIASKRSLVAAVLNVTGASDVFTQDMEDLQASLDSTPRTGKAPNAETVADKVRNEIRSGIPDWMPDGFTKEIEALLEEAGDGEDLEKIRVEFLGSTDEGGEDGVFSQLLRVPELGKHKAFNAEADRKTIAEGLKKLSANGWTAQAVADFVDLWALRLDKRQKARDEKAEKPAETAEAAPETAGEDEVVLGDG